MDVHPEIAELRRRLAGEMDGESSDHGAAYARYEELGGHAIEVKAKKILSGLSFRESDFQRSLHTLSGGWIMRAHLARLLVMEPDLLMLDEPTNHLDLHSVLWFQQYLSQYPGALLFISHDRAFLNRLADSTIELREASSLAIEAITTIISSSRKKLWNNRGPLTKINREKSNG